ncbi:MAG: prolipoprotein diacylglyceryl transferase [Gammaproteobacteria bacterium]|nr:prolipoprotein diacylglyceryl transferase [Gammaproteobacteria bacterium]
MPEVDSGSSIALLVMGVIYAGGFLVAAWWFVRRLSRKERPDREKDSSGRENSTAEPECEETTTK